MRDYYLCYPAILTNTLVPQPSLSSILQNQLGVALDALTVAHEGLALLGVDLHEVGDLLARTNSLVQLHNLVGGSQVTPSQSRRHHSPRSNKWCVGNELLALVLQMIVSPTLNSLS